MLLTTDLEAVQAVELDGLSRQINRQFTEIIGLRKALCETLGDLARANARVVALPVLGTVT